MITIHKFPLKPSQIDGVCTFAELSVPLTARLAELLGLPGPLTSATDQVPGGAQGKNQGNLGILDDFMGFYGILWDFMGFCGIFMDVMGLF